MSSNSQPGSPSTPIRRAAPVGTAKVLLPSAERQRASPEPGYAQPKHSKTPTPTAKRAPQGASPEATSASGKKRAGGTSKSRKKAAAAKVNIDFSVRAPSDEELYDGSTEAPPAAVEDAAKEEALIREFDADGVEARLSGIKVDTMYMKTPRESEYVDDAVVEGKK